MRGFFARAGLLLGDLFTSFGLGGRARPPATRPDVLRLVARARPEAALAAGIAPAARLAAHEPPTAVLAPVAPSAALAARPRPSATLH